jgi:3-hydroxybutyryl-CoA dehydratase
MDRSDASSGSISMTVGEREIGLYADLTNDYNPIHVDAVFAAGTEMGGVIAHGTMSLNLLWQWIAARFGADAVAGTELDVRFRRPVRIGDVLEAGGVPAQSEQYEVWVRNQDGVNVIEGTARFTAS